MTPKELLFAHRYPEAVDAYKSHLRQHPEQNYYPGLGDAFLCVGRFPEAVSTFKKALEIESNRTKGHMGFLNQVGTALWLTGDRTGAIGEWHHAVSGILDGSSIYGDLAGGATQGLLLWYGAVTLNDRQEHEYAIKYFHYLQRRKTYGHVLWPRPVFEMVLGEKSFEKMLVDGIGSPDLATCVQIARTDLLKRRFLCQALFYGACREREAGDETACLEKMQACFHLENPVIEVEWYLARGECSPKRT
jgi:tetratricopeptide (TPR) repeat protein